MLSLVKVSKSFGNKQAVKNLSLEITKGEVFGFLGPNGAGKTTCVKLILGLLSPDEGTIKLLGENPQNTEIKAKIGFLAEQASLYRYLTGREFLEFSGELFSLDQKQLDQKIPQLLNAVKLSKQAADQRINTYSKGMKQRLSLAQALINDPELLILDEPLSGLDPLGQKELRDLILEQKAQGKTIFFNSHILADVEQIATRIAIIAQGKLLATKSLISKTATTFRLEDFFLQTIQQNSA
jgi:ABC-2 type transport system ATP-binding protein